MSIIMCCSALTALSTRQVLQALGLSHLDYCSVVLSSATKKDLAQNREARLALDVHRELILIICMSISPGSKWRRDWLHRYMYSWEVLTCWMHRALCLNYWRTAWTPICGSGGVGAWGHTVCCEISECIVMFLKLYKLPSRQRLFNLKRLRKCGLSQGPSQCSTGAQSNTYGKSTAADHKALQRVVCSAEHTIGSTLPALQDTYNQCSL